VIQKRGRNEKSLNILEVAKNVRRIQEIIARVARNRKVAELEIEPMTSHS
jgi:hypothetical protein